MQRPFGPAPFVRALVLATTSFLGLPCLPASPVAAAPDCLAAPDTTPTAGRRWFYRLDRGTSRKCWYLREADEPRPATGETAETAPAPATPLAPASAERPARPLTASERDVLFQEFLAWRLQQPSAEETAAGAAR
ncbi:MAG: hypothetical protein HXX10_01885 [Rhodoplanes sp.]|uniref:hypothetical protein n=1 Tax=Rhodoplanes sp. TaxID=1968906 RepID=UPI0017F9A71A|nr:hypothetical protein [Rhodoplanes sp.]NVO12764.1 hypothetical protein [Rhodoplanes sp.]